MDNTIIGIFRDRSDVENAINELHAKGFSPKDISIVMKDKKEAQDVGNDTGANVAGGAASGIATGAVVGGIAGLLAGIAIPGLGAFLIGGPIAAALGVGGTTAATVSGVATGAVAGGLIGALMGLGLSREDAEHYQTRVQEGAILAAVPVSDNDLSYVKGIFDQYHASDVKTVSAAREGVHETSRNRHYADREETEHAHHGQAQYYVHSGAKGGSTTHRKRGRKGGMAMPMGQTQHGGSMVNPIQVQKYIKGVDYPCSKDDLIETARNEGADDNVIMTLQKMPGDQFDSPKSVSKAIGEIE